MELMKLSNPCLVNFLSLLIAFICRMFSSGFYTLPKALLIGISFKSKLTTFGDLSPGVDAFNIRLLLTTIQ